MIPTAEKLLDIAKKGEKLSPTERRHVVSFVMATNYDATNDELAEIFKCTERVVRLDKQKIRQERSKLIRDEDVGLVIADILMDYDRNIRDIEKSKRVAKVGTPNYRQHCESAMKMRLDTTRALQDLGWLPKNLGNLTVAKFAYKAVVERDGSIVNRPLDMLIPDPADERERMLSLPDAAQEPIRELLADESEPSEPNGTEGSNPRIT